MQQGQSTPNNPLRSTTKQSESAVRKACPTLPDDAKATVMQVIASARNEWIRSTAKLVNEAVDAMAQDDSDDVLQPDKEYMDDNQ